jgi:hypothetical protein
MLTFAMLTPTCALALPLPLLAGEGWEEVKLLIFASDKEQPHPSPPLHTGEGAAGALDWLLATNAHDQCDRTRHA